MGTDDSRQDGLVQRARELYAPAALDPARRAELRQRVEARTSGRRWRGVAAAAALASAAAAVLVVWLLLAGPGEGPGPAVHPADGWVDEVFFAGERSSESLALPPAFAELSELLGT